MPEKMTVAEGLNEIKRIHDLVMDKCTRINRYSSKLRKEPDEIENQEKYVEEQAQSVEHLIDRYTNIRTAINSSNLTAEITYHENGKDMQMTVAEAILFKQEEGVHYMMSKLYDSFSTGTANRQLQNYLASRQGGTRLEEDELEKLDLVAHRYYDEKEIMEKKELIDNFRSKLDVLLDASNHQTSITI